MMKKYFNLRLLSVILCLLAAGEMAFAGVKLGRASACIRQQSTIEENWRSCEEQSRKLQKASDYLTGTVWHYIATAKEEHLQDYWNEVNTEKNRDTAMEELRKLGLTEEEQELIDRAKAESDALIQGESWAMRLVAESIGMPLEQMPREVAAVSLSAQESALAPAAKKALALKYIFGEQYTGSKLAINGAVSEFHQALQDRKSTELSEAVEQTRAILAQSQLYSFFGLISLIVAAVLFYVFGTRPLVGYVRSIEKINGEGFTPLRPAGAEETRAFAEVFNRLYSDWDDQTHRLEEERFRFLVAMENASVVVFEYDIKGDIFTSYGSLTQERSKESAREGGQVIRNFMSEHVKEFLPESNLGTTNLQPADLSVAERVLQVREGEDCPFIWASVSASAIRDEDGNITKFIGKISNIQAEKEAELALEESRSRDRLTGFYNRNAGMKKIQEYLESKEEGEPCCFLMLDMDDFGKINDTDGMTFADAILQEAADALRSAAGPGDILFRLGGDEFAMMAPNCGRERAASMAEAAVSGVRRLCGRENSELHVSASAGVCVGNGKDGYGAWFRKAFGALQYAKSQGKDRFAFYRELEADQIPPLEGSVGSQVDEIPTNSGSMQGDLPSFALELLANTRNLDDAVFLLLARIGKTFDLDRVSIAQMDSEYLNFRITYQWSKRLSDGQVGQTFFLSREELKEVAESYDEEGLCDRYQVGKNFKMKSVLHAGIWDHGRYIGNMYFEREEADCHWSEEERKNLREMARIVASFVLKAKADAVSQAKTNFLSRMSHEIRTPMNAISGMTTIAKSVLGDREKTLECLDKIEAANKYLLGLINDVLDMSRIESGKLELNSAKLSLKEQADQLEDLMRPQAQTKGLTLEFQNNCEQLSPVCADELRLNQVLLNIIGNAIKFTDAGGRVAVRYEPVEVREDGVTVRFSVCDNGVGIRPEAVNRIFHAFEQAETDTAVNYGGTGLGLSISNRLVQMMGGTLEVKSELGKGSEFYFTLSFPYVGAEEKTEETAPETAAEVGPLAGRKILLAEDNELNREIAGTILSMYGMTVEEAKDGQEAVNLFSEREPGYYDAILMDIRMPVMGGLEAARNIRMLERDDSRTVPIIAMTANAFDEDMKESLESGMNGHLSKPIDVEKLLFTLNNCIADSEKSAKP